MKWFILILGVVCAIIGDYLNSLTLLGAAIVYLACSGVAAVVEETQERLLVRIDKLEKEIKKK